MKKRLFLWFSLFGALCVVPFCVSASVTWDDVFYSSGPYKGSEKISWEKMTEEEKAFSLEYYRDNINYCLSNIGKISGDIDSERDCCVSKNAPVSYYMIALKYMLYGDPSKAAEYYYMDWLDSQKNPDWRPFNAEESPLSVVIFGYERAGLYSQALPFYERAYVEMETRLKVFSDVSMLKNDFNRYKNNWPEEAEEYSGFMSDWSKAKKLAKTVRPKPLDSAVQNHEWFYSDKITEVLKALEYYKTNKVKFMLEKAANDKRPAIAKKAKEYLDNWDTSSAMEKQPTKVGVDATESKPGADKK